MINQQFRHHFPFWAESDWVYLDSAATTLKPQILLDETLHFYRSAGSVHRSQYDLAQSESYELARDLVARRFNIADRQAVVWTSGTTHAINLVAQGLEQHIQPNDEIVISVAEHHANFIPWQQLAKRTGAKLIVLPLNEAYQIDPQALCQQLSSHTKIVAFNLVSNVTGVRQPAEQLISCIRQYSNALIFLDIAQAVCSEKVDVQKLDADFYAFSAHKMYGPTGLGVLMGKIQSLEKIRPLFYGGKMLETLSEQHLTLANLPYRLEAGTPNIAGIITFGKVLQWLERWDFAALNQSLYVLAELAYKGVRKFENVQILGSHLPSATFSFFFHDMHHADIAAMLTEQKIALRVGEHCAKPYLRYLQQTGTLRVSLAHYNTEQDLKRFLAGLALAVELLRG